MYAYRLKNTGAGSEKYGACECCGASVVGTTYLLVEMRRYTKPSGTEGITYHGCIAGKFGHRECLVDMLDTITTMQRPFVGNEK